MERLDPKTLHSTLGRTVAIVIWAASVGMVAANTATDGLRGGLSVLAPAALAAFVAFAVFWAPQVSVGPDGLWIRNILRSYRVSWSSITSVEMGMALVISTAHGRITVWSAPAPSTGASRYGRGGAYSRMGSDSGDVAMFVRARWAELQRSGRIPVAAPGHEGYVRNWHVVSISVFAVLAVAAVVTVILTR